MGQSGSRVRKVFAACCWTELVLGIVGFGTVVWIKNSGINTNVKGQTPPAVLLVDFFIFRLHPRHNRSIVFHTVLDLGSRRQLV
jgi:hypothetical protein